MNITKSNTAYLLSFTIHTCSLEMSLLGVTAKAEPEKEQAMSLVITLPQTMSSSSSSSSSSSGIGMTQIKNRNLPHAQRNINTNTDHLTILSTIHPISRSSARKSSKNRKSFLFRATIIVVFVLAGVLLFSDQILTSWNNIKNSNANGEGPATTTAVSKEKLLQQQQQQQQQQRVNTNDLIVEEKKITIKNMAGDEDNSNEQEDSMIQGTVIIGGDDDQKIAYYHQAAALPLGGGESSSSIQQNSLVLLHGSKFTKEDWIKNSRSSTSKNIISMFHKQFPYSISITAVDLPVRADHYQLVSLLDAMQDKGLISLPVSLVTPSASGFSIVDWIMNDDTNKLPKYIHTWIPVASGSASRFTEEQLTNVDLLEDFNIFAIYGNLDKSGKKVTKKLVKQASTITKSLELNGGHPVYLDSPNAFVNAIGLEIIA
jgi:hypothetical protein